MQNGIQRISKLRNFGVYEDFFWGDLTDFKSSSLIYGWNYSGKTTLSKLFQILEFKQNITHFVDAEFSIAYSYEDEERTLSLSNIDEFPFGVKVFNSGYVSRIFTWDDPKQSIEPISFYLGGTATEKYNELQALKNRKNRWEDVFKKRYGKIISQFEEYDKTSGKFSKEAAKVRDDYLPRLLKPNEFNKSHFSRRVVEVCEKIESYLLKPENLEEDRRQALDSNTYEIQEKDFIFEPSLIEISSSVTAILEDSAPQVVAQPRLDRDKILFDWVQTGLSLHDGAEECFFCNSTIEKDRVNDLNAYYSDKLKEIQASIKKALKEIGDEREKINIIFPPEGRIISSLTDEYQERLGVYRSVSEEYLRQLSILEEDLETKGESLFNTVPASEIEGISILPSLKLIQETIAKSNVFVVEAEALKEASKNKVIKHYVAKFLEEEGYNEKKRACDEAKRKEKLISEELLQLEGDINKTSSELSNTVKGQEELNVSLQILLGREDIKVSIQDEKFILQRGELPALSFSEGEKSAIAFVYFMTELKALRSNRALEKTIIFIDDPISSLDSNHIFQVRSLIKDFFHGGRGSFCQLFISTHNFEFFSMLLDSRIFGRITENTTEEKRPLYFIERCKNGTARMKKLPKSFSSYKSEYVALYRILKDYRDLENKEEFPNPMLLPNALRRFTELYTLMKYPTTKKVDDRLKELFSSDNRYRHSGKLLHWFSHLNQFERVKYHDDKLLQVGGAIDELFTFIENEDPLHWKGLEEGC